MAYHIGNIIGYGIWPQFRGHLVLKFGLWQKEGQQGMGWDWIRLEQIRLPLATITIIFVASSYEALYTNYR